MKAHELREKSPEELEALLREKRERLDLLGSLVRQKKTKNVKEIVAVKKDIARILTIARI